MSAGHAGRGVEVTDVGLHRSEPQDPAGISPGLKTRVSASNSIGSPMGVPVPCASM